MQLIVQPEHGLDPILRTILRARRSIDVCIFRLDRGAIERALADAVKRGVRVRALNAQPESGAAPRKVEERLLAAGITVARAPDELLRYHSKFMLVDDTLHLYAFNFTKRDILKSRSFGIATRDRRTVQEALKLFEADSTHQPYVPSPSNLVISPDNARRSLGQFIQGSRRELAIYDDRIHDRQMIELLKLRAHGGVRIRVIGKMKKPGDGIEVRPLRKNRLHVRAIIRDGARAFVGSQSLRTLELDRRREVGLMIHSAQVTHALMEVFEFDWLLSAEAKEDRPVVVEDAAAPG
ncbi:MAG TPA: phospholipase D-like domain-containing protein [Candidatus Polarisedimenticolaceae bacterium]|nr:phospholipase D-like domain-containing protein [Candidatus Polarisedimenticolaceae bacterium]